MGQLLRISDNFSSEAAEPDLLKISCGLSVGQGNERFLKNGSIRLTKMAVMPIYGKNTLKIFVSSIQDAMGLNLCTNYRGWEICQRC